MCSCCIVLYTQQCMLSFFFCLCQVLGTALLLLCLMALSDQRNKPAAAGTEPIAVGLLVLLIGISIGRNSGYAINPTRDIAPRLFTAVAGWGMDVFRYIHDILASGDISVCHFGFIWGQNISVNSYSVLSRVDCSYIEGTTASGFKQCKWKTY